MPAIIGKRVNELSGRRGTSMQPYTIFIFGDIHLPIVESVAHQAGDTPSLQIISVQNCPLANRPRHGA
jgi:hypothetical protein